MGSGPEESASPQSGGHQEGDGEAEVGRAGPGGAPHAGLLVLLRVIAAVPGTALDVEMGQSVGFSHMEALAPRGRGTASHGVVRVPQL